MTLRRRALFALPALGLAKGNGQPVFLGGCNFSREQFETTGGKQSDLEKFDAADVRVIVTAVGSGSYFQTGEKQFELAGDDEWILGMQRKNVNEAVAAIRACPQARLITTKAEMRRDPQPGTLGAILHISGNNHTFRVETVDEFARLGVRAWHPALPYHNRWCSAKEGMPGPVLTDFGREAIARMNERGILVDTAHATDESARAFIKASKRPVIDTHTTSSTLIPDSRGHDDGTLKMIADSGGVIGVQFAEQFLRRDVWKRKYNRAGANTKLWEYNKGVLAGTRDPEERMLLRRTAATRSESVV